MPTIFIPRGRWRLVRTVSGAWTQKSFMACLPWWQRWLFALRLQRWQKRRIELGLGAAGLADSSGRPIDTKPRG